MTNSDDLTVSKRVELINGILVGIGKVAELVDKISENGSKEMSLAIKESGDRLRDHVNALALQASGIEILDGDPVKVTESLTDIATKECLASFKKVKELRESGLTNHGDSDLQIKAFDSLSNHARELFAIISGNPI